MVVTATFGMVAAGHLLRKLAGQAVAPVAADAPSAGDAAVAAAHAGQLADQ
jgi:hypothetical protein